MASQIPWTIKSVIRNAIFQSVCETGLAWGTDFLTRGKENAISLKELRGWHEDLFFRFLFSRVRAVQGRIATQFQIDPKATVVPLHEVIVSLKWACEGYIWDQNGRTGLLYFRYCESHA